MSSAMTKAGRALRAYRELLIEPPARERVKRFLFAVNGWCNSRCTFCNIWQYDKATALGEEITVEELERNLFGSAALADVIDIGITGGEPFLRKDIAALVGALYRAFPRARIGAVTNGIRARRIVDAAEQIAAANPGRTFAIAVSLDGYGETHDTVRGVRGNFASILATIEQLRARAPSVTLGFSHTVTPLTMQDSLRCYELARELGIGFIYRLAHDAPYLRNQGAAIWSAESLAAVRPVVEELNRRLLADQTIGARLGNTGYAQITFYDQMLDYFERPRRTCDCYSGTHSFLLGHDGGVYACVNMPQSMGNLRRQPFDAIWSSAQADAVRAPIAAWDCHCWTNCETELSLARQPAAFLHGLGRNLGGLLPGGARPEVIPLEPTAAVPPQQREVSR